MKAMNDFIILERAQQVGGTVSTPTCAHFISYHFYTLPSPLHFPTSVLLLMSMSDNSLTDTAPLFALFCHSTVER